MAVKYHCPKCNKKFVDWGAEKLTFKCPDCEGEELVLWGMAERESSSAKPSLKRKKRATKTKKKAASAKTKKSASAKPKKSASAKPKKSAAAKAKKAAPAKKKA